MPLPVPEVPASQRLALDCRTLLDHRVGKGKWQSLLCLHYREERHKHTNTELKDETPQYFCQLVGEKSTSLLWILHDLIKWCSLLLHRSVFIERRLNTFFISSLPPIFSHCGSVKQPYSCTHFSPFNQWAQCTFGNYKPEQHNESRSSPSTLFYQNLLLIIDLH